MEVTKESKYACRHNRIAYSVHADFEAVLPDVIAAIERCSFVAFDCEFTGQLASVHVGRPRAHFMHGWCAVIQV